MVRHRKLLLPISVLLRIVVKMNVFQCGSALNAAGSRCWWQTSAASPGSFGSTIT